MIYSCIILLAAVQALSLKSPIGGKVQRYPIQLDGILTYVLGDEINRKGIRFYPEGGSLAVISLDGKTVFRERAESQIDNAGALTHRPLLNNELFEVKVDRNLNKDKGYPMGIGVTTHSPSNLIFPLWLKQIPNGAWMLYDRDLYIDGRIQKSNYGKGLHNLKHGDRVGVMRTEDGNLHFFINGVDQGLAASGIPSSVYGAVDLTRDIAQVTIVEK